MSKILEVEADEILVAMVLQPFLLSIELSDFVDESVGSVVAGRRGEMRFTGLEAAPHFVVNGERLRLPLHARWLFHLLPVQASTSIQRATWELAFLDH